MYENKNKIRTKIQQIVQTKRYYFMKDLTFKCAEKKLLLFFLLILRVGVFFLVEEF